MRAFPPPPLAPALVPRPPPPPLPLTLLDVDALLPTDPTLRTLPFFSILSDSWRPSNASRMKQRPSKRYGSHLSHTFAPPLPHSLLSHRSPLPHSLFSCSPSFPLAHSLFLLLTLFPLPPHSLLLTAERGLQRQALPQGAPDPAAVKSHHGSVQGPQRTRGKDTMPSQHQVNLHCCGPYPRSSQCLSLPPSPSSTTSSSSCSNNNVILSWSYGSRSRGPRSFVRQVRASGSSGITCSGSNRVRVGL